MKRFKPHFVLPSVISLVFQGCFPKSKTRVRLCQPYRNIGHYLPVWASASLAVWIRLLSRNLGSAKIWKLKRNFANLENGGRQPAGRIQDSDDDLRIQSRCCDKNPDPLTQICVSQDLQVHQGHSHEQARKVGLAILSDPQRESLEVA